MHFFCLCLGVRHGVGFINCIIFYNYRNPYPFRIKKKAYLMCIELLRKRFSLLMLLFNVPTC